MKSRGIRNNNPGNIRRDGTAWQGMAKDQSGDHAFVVFSAPEWGIRAIARVLITYQDQHGLRTIRAIISRWAPAVENDTEAYVRAVANAVGVPADAEIDVHTYADLEPLVRAIIKHENGSQPYAQSVIDEGLRRAGVIRPASVAAVVRTPEAVGAGIAGTAGLGAALMDSASSLRATSASDSTLIAILIAVLTLAGVGLTIFGIVRKLRR